MRHFLTALLREEKVISEQMHHIAPMIFTEVEKVAFDQARICHICEKPLEGDKVSYHCHKSKSELKLYIC